MRDGVVQQIGTPGRSIPIRSNTFVADFVGQCNFLPSTIERAEKYTTVRTDAGVELKVAYTDGLDVGKRVICTIRPENLLLEEPHEEHNVMDCRITNGVFLGSSSRIYTTLGDRKIVADARSSVELKSGESLRLYTLPRVCRYFPSRMPGKMVHHQGLAPANSLAVSIRRWAGTNGAKTLAYCGLLAATTTSLDPSCR